MQKLGKELEHLMEELNSGKACSPHQKSAAAEDHSAAEVDSSAAISRAGYQVLYTSSKYYMRNGKDCITVFQGQLS